MRKVYGLLLIVMLACLGCQWRLKSSEEASEDRPLTIERYDRMESLYLTTGDYSALLQMNKTYPMQTRTLIEDVLRIGKVNDPDINAKFLEFFSDSTLQLMISDVQSQYEDIEDVCSDLSSAFSRLKKEIPSLELPQIYTQIGSFDQSIVVGNKTLGISLDKYLGTDYPFYVEHYTEQQRQMMTRSMIIPDCMGFYLLSLYPMPSQELTREERDIHMGKIQWVVNKVTKREVFNHDYVVMVDSFMRRHKDMTIEQLLRNNNYSEIR